MIRWICLVMLVTGCAVAAEPRCSDRKTERYGDFLEVEVCLAPVSQREDGLRGVESFTLTYVNLTDRGGYLVLASDPLENVYVTARVGKSILPRRQSVVCNPDAACPYKEYQPSVSPGQRLSVEYRMEDVLPSGGEAGREHGLWIAAPRFIVLQGEDRRQALRKYAPLERRLRRVHVEFNFEGVPLFPASFNSERE